MLSEINTLFSDAAMPAPSEDRRITKRFADAWSQRAKGGFPSWPEIRAVDIGEDWNWAFAVDLEKSTGFPYFIYLGAHLAKLSDVYLSGDADWTISLLDKATAEVDRCIAVACPHQRDDELVLCNGRRLLFRSVTAPLADDGELISHVAGVVSGRFAD